ncbi:MAG: hypothetical protein IJ574_01810 [Bacilli bacterium]|nr:hypothetical protein [Bacilli bacterium]
MNIWQDKNFEPMLLNEIDKPFDSDDYIYEIKYDGIRALIFIGPNTFIIKSRNNKDLTNLFPELIKIKKNFTNNTILDGEIVLFDNDNKPSFSKLQTRMHLKNELKIKYESINNPVCFVTFDILYDNKSLLKHDLLKRKEILNKISDNDYLIKTKYINKEGIKLFDLVKKERLEGIVAKRKDSIYEINTRSNNWIKIKNTHNDNFTIIGFKDVPTNYVFTIYLVDNNNYVGKASLAKRNKLYQELKEIIINKKIISINEDNITYVKPIYNANITYLEKTNNNHLRHPVFNYYDKE